MSNEKVRWGLLACGNIARAFAKGLAQSETGALLAVASRNPEKADSFAREFGAPRRYGAYEELLADRDVEAVYISTPHPLHVEWALRAAEAGKHLLVEKPLAVNAADAEMIVETARERGVFLMEAYMYRCHPQTALLVRLLRDGAIGEVGVIQATFSFRSAFDPRSRLWNNDLAGGGILDVGGYTTSMARLVVGTARGRPFADPLSVSGAGRRHPETGVDVWAAGVMRFEEGIVATIATGIGLVQENCVRVFGSEGHLLVPNPFVAHREKPEPGRIFVHRQGIVTPEEFVVPSEVTSYAHEADVCGRAIRAGRTEPEPPAMTWADTLGNLCAQDAWRAAIGLTYESEKPENYGRSAARRPLVRRPDAEKMPYGRIPPLDKPISRLVMGVDNQDTMPHAAMIFSDYFERGGNAFDTAWVYGRRRSELLGAWVRAHGLRESVVIVAKGAHPPFCTPEAASRQLQEQLEWLGTDYADLYFLHRDNPEVPVGEFVDMLDEQVRAGRLRAFGGSNWTIERVKKANAYARRKGRQGFSAISNNLSLAVMVQPPWSGCLHLHDPASLRWLKRTQMPVMPWSSQARGFFIPERARPDRCDDESLVRCWYSPENFERQARAIALAKKYGVDPVAIALAWVLGQPFPTFPLIGPRHIAETRSSFRALEVHLTPREMRYLDLQTKD
jgi:predicted dehydrogenase/aryl-alcohol dehydrogenase-like predicted oxidoreductase